MFGKAQVRLQASNKVKLRKPFTLTFCAAAHSDFICHFHEGELYLKNVNKELKGE